MTAPVDASARLTRPGAAALTVLLVADGIAVGLLSVMFLPLRAGAVPLPVSAVLAGAALVAVMIGAARWTDSPGILAAPAAGWLVVYLAAAAGGPGGDGVLASDWRAMLLLLAGLVPPALWLGNRALGRAYARGSAGALPPR